MQGMKVSDPLLLQDTKEDKRLIAQHASDLEQARGSLSPPAFGCFAHRCTSARSDEDSGTAPRGAARSRTASAGSRREFEAARRSGGSAGWATWRVMVEASGFHWAGGAPGDNK